MGNNVRSSSPRRLLFVIIALLVFAAAVLALDARSLSLVRNTLLLIAATLAISAPIGTFLGLALARTQVPLRHIAMVLLAGGLFVPLYLHAAAWQAGFGQLGWFTLIVQSGGDAAWLEGWRGAIWVHACAAVPWVALFVGVAARDVPPELEETALLDIDGWQVFTRVTLRSCWPALGLAALWVAVTVASEIGATDFFGVRTYAEELYVELNIGGWTQQMPPPGMAESQPTGVWPGAVVTGFMLLVALVLCLRLVTRPILVSRRNALVLPLGRLQIAITFASWLLIGILVGIPLGSLIFKAGLLVSQVDGGYVRSWSLVKFITMVAQSPAANAREFGWTLLISTTAASVAMLIALPLAYFSRTSRVVAALAMLLAVTALALPGPLVGLAVISLFDQPDQPWLHALYDRSIAPPVIAQALRALPLVMFIAWAGLSSIPRAMFETAMLDGANATQRLLLAVRLRWPALAIAWLAGFVVAIGELAATILVVPPGVEPLSIRIFGLLHYNVEDQVAAICLALIVLHAGLGLIVLMVARRLLMTVK